MQNDCHRLISERNLRHYMAITDFTNFDKENHDVLFDLFKEAEQNGVLEVYREEASKYLSKMKMILDARQIQAFFEGYPVREYPPDPKWDKRRKQWLDGVTGKPIDPKKPQILPLNPPKKKKGKKKQEEFQIPEWAKERKVLVEKIAQLQELIGNENNYFDASFVQKATEHLN